MRLTRDVIASITLLAVAGLLLAPSAGAVSTISPTPGSLRAYTISAANQFARDQKVALYVEVYEPSIVANPQLRVGIIYNIFDKKTNQQVYTSNTKLVNQFAQAGNLVIPVADQLPVDKLNAGDYRIDVIARDADGHVSSTHSAEFSLN